MNQELQSEKIQESLMIIAEKFKEGVKAIHLSELNEGLNQTSKRMAEIESLIIQNLTFTDEFAEKLNAYFHNTSYDFDQVVEAFDQRMLQLKEITTLFNDSIFKRVRKQLQMEFKIMHIDKSLAKDFINKLSKSLQNVLISHLISFEENVINEVIERELNSTFLDCAINSPIINLLVKRKLEKYRNKLKKSIQAIYLEFEMQKSEDNCFNAIVSEFIKRLLKRIDQGIHARNQMEVSQSLQRSEQISSSISYPKDIFKNEAAFLIFQKYIQNTTKADDYAFIYRIMSEDKQKYMVCQPKKFIDWIHESYNPNVSLANALKPLYNIGEQELRLKAFEMAKELVFSNRAIA